MAITSFLVYVKMFKYPPHARACARTCTHARNATQRNAMQRNATHACTRTHTRTHTHTRYLQNIPKMAVLFKTLGAAAVDIALFLVMFAIIFWAFMSTYYLAFGKWNHALSYGLYSYGLSSYGLYSYGTTVDSAPCADLRPH